MRWTIEEIKNHGDLLYFDETLQIKKQVIDRGSSIIDVSPVHVKGYVLSVGYDIVLHADVEVEVVVPSTRTLEPVALQLHYPIKERYVTHDPMDPLSDYEETLILLEHDYIDLEPAVIDSILLNIPVKVIGTSQTEQSLPKGNDWQVITEEEFIQQREEEIKNTIDPRLAGLQALLKDQEED